METRETGSGPPLIFVHGSFSDLRGWDEIQPRLATRFRTVAYSRRYHWPNEPIPEGADYDLLEHVADLLGVIEAVSDDPVHLVGHSYGGFVALLATMRRPERVRKLVLAEPPIVPLLIPIPPSPGDLARLLLKSPRAALAVIDFGARGLGPATRAFERGDSDEGLRIFGRAVLGKAAFEALGDERREQVFDNTIDAEFLGSGLPPIDAAEVEALHVPTLLVGGGKSPALFGAVLDRLEELLPDASRARVPAASHIIHDDDPDTFTRVVLDFLDSPGDA